MTMFDNGVGPLARTLADGVTVTKCTPGIILASGKVRPCLAGEACDGIFNDTVVHVKNGIGVGLLAPWDGGGLGIHGLAWGPVVAGEALVIKISAADGLPKFASATDDGLDDQKIAGYAALGTSAPAEDVANADGVIHPSLAVRLIPAAAGLIVGGETTDTYEDFHIELADIANGDLVTDFVPGFAFELVSFKFVTEDPVTTAAKLSNVHLEIGAVPVTGGVLALTSAAATPRGKVISATAITALNTGSATDAFSLVAADTTAFVEGSGTFKVRVRHAA